MYTFTVMYTYTVVYTYIVMYSYGENGLPDAGNTRTLRHSATGVYRDMDAYSVTETSYTYGYRERDYHMYNYTVVYSSATDK